MGVLGPNGAGKTTLVRILTTLLPPAKGVARVAGYDVVTEGHLVRSVLGVAFQGSAIDLRLTTRENLRLHGLLQSIPWAERKGRVAQVISWMQLEEVADKTADILSGGFRRRVEIARAFLHNPTVVILDEPTASLDPRSRQLIWQKLLSIPREERPTVFLTTHDMDDGMRCDRLLVMDHGRVVAEGTPRELCQRAGTERVILSTADNRKAALELKKRLGIEPAATERGLEFPVEDGAAILPLLQSMSAGVRSLTIRRPTLEDAFFAITGHQMKAPIGSMQPPGEGP
jgi:ABC-2 type transport system ATP-binding protein